MLVIPAAIVVFTGDFAKVVGGQIGLGSVFRQNPRTVTALLAAGADPAAGTPSAVATAELFGLPEMASLLRQD